jgi:hypothetical protein
MVTRWRTRRLDLAIERARVAVGTVEVAARSLGADRTHEVLTAARQDLHRAATALIVAGRASEARDRLARARADVEHVPAEPWQRMVDHVVARLPVPPEPAPQRVDAHLAPRPLHSPRAAGVRAERRMAAAAPSAGSGPHGQ